MPMDPACPAGRRLRWVAVALLLVVAMSPGVGSAFAQSQTTAADLRGVVVDNSGAVVAGVSVSVVNLVTGHQRAATTSPDGRYAIHALPIGSYRLEAQLPGFEPLVVPEVRLSLGSPTVADLVLQVAGVSYDLVV